MSLSILYPVHSGELDEERRSLALGAREADATPVGLHDISRHREAETRARYTAGSGVSAKEFRKDLGLLAERDAHALVPHLDPHGSVLRSALTSTTPPWGEYLIAFEIRFPITCRSRSGFPITASGAWSISTATSCFGLCWL